jgi:hypothetical protein
MLTKDEKKERLERMQAKKAVAAPWLALVLDDRANEGGPSMAKDGEKSAVKGKTVDKDRGEDSKSRNDEENRRRMEGMRAKKVAAAKLLAVMMDVGGVPMTNDSRREGNTSPAGAAPVGKEQVEKTSWGSGHSDVEVAENLLATSTGSTREWPLETGSEGRPVDPGEHSKRCRPTLEDMASKESAGERTLKKPRDMAESFSDPVERELSMVPTQSGKEKHALDRIGSPQGNEGSVSHGMECSLVSEPASDRKVSFSSSTLGCEYVCWR